jgi:hypothetical protein
MAWENIAKKQADLLTRLLDDALTRWRAAKGGTTGDQMAKDIVSIWSRALDFWWGPFNTGDPTVPTLLIQAAPGDTGPVPGDIRLAEDTKKADVSLTALGLVGGNQLFTGGVSHDVVNRSTLKVEIRNVPNSVPGSTDLYQGVALKGKEPIAVIMVKVG